MPSIPSLRDPDRAARNLTALAAHLGTDPAPVLAPLLPRVADADMALNNLERLFASPAARPHWAALLADDRRGLEHLLHLFATSQFFADTLLAYPEAVPAVIAPPRRNPTTAELTADLGSEVEAASDEPGVLRAFRRFRQLHTLRIGVNDILLDRPLEEVTRELARLADAALEVALQTALRAAAKQLGHPATKAGTPARVAALAFGKLGGDELNYSSDIDLMFVYDEDGVTTGKRGGTANAAFFARVVQDVIRLLAKPTDRGFAYRVDLRLRPEGKTGPLARSLPATLSYYDVMGRTWERQALIKVRPVAGDLELGREFVTAIEPFVYRKYFSFSEINEVKALKRRMEAAAARGGVEDRDVKTGRGGIRDIEYTVQFLQLLNGGDLPAVRQRNTLLALDALEIAGCLTPQETYILADAYRFLRKTEHRLQLLFDWQTHKLPATSDEVRTLARRMGYLERGARNAERGTEESTKSGSDSALRVPGSTLSAQRRSPLDELPPAAPLDAKALLVDPLDRFLKDYQDKTRLDRAILDHLLHQTFAGGSDRAEPEADLILDPDPDDAAVRAALGRYPFRDVPAAYRNLMKLAQEAVRFLSHRRCRHFLASIAPQLLRAVAETPDPDLTLNNFERVTASLGAKAVLYELFSFNPPSLKLYVDICANSPYLIGILTSNPGMIDELLDSLLLDQPRTAEELRAELGELLRGASDPDPILHSFQDKELLRVGVRDLLGRAAVRETTAGLSDIADTVLNAVFDRVEPKVREKHGAAGCRYAVLGLGKLGGREISYHSDLDLVVVYEADGPTARDRPAPSTNARFFTDLTQRVIKHMSAVGPFGRLYDVDMKLRPAGKSSSLVVPLAEFRRYFAGGGGELWERQALTRARVIRGDAAFAGEVTAAVRSAILEAPWTPAAVDAVRAMREKLEATANPRNLKRGPGGIVDVEFVIQLLMLKYARRYPDILRPNAWDALGAAEAAGLLAADEARDLRDGYSFLRFVEARLRVVTDRPLTEVPAAAEDREKLARRLGFDPAGGGAAAAFAKELDRQTARVRAVYDRITHRERGT
jgi:glutamate-ammonia-ligase adenylyltransferase